MRCVCALTRCALCGKGERAGGHDWKTGKAKDGHVFKNNNLPDDLNEYGFKDRFVANKHKAEKL